MVRNKWYQKGIVCFWALVMCFLLLPAPVGAWEKIDTEQAVSLKISYRDGERILSGVSFSLYRVAEVNEAAKFRLVDPFRKYEDSVTLKHLDTEGWKQAAITLKGYAQRDDLPVTAEGKTNASGEVVFTGLETGMYLVVGERTKVGNYKYMAEPFLVSLPDFHESQQSWEYDLQVNVKYDRDYQDGGGGGKEPEKIWKVLKVWKDDEHRGERPEKVVIQLLRDGKVYDTVTLKESNNWHHTWKDLDEQYEWTVVEKEINAYTVAVDRNGTTFVVINTHEDEPEDSKEPEKPEYPENPDEPDEPIVLGDEDEKNYAEKPDKPSVIGKEKLPKTGVLWWPVPLLGCGGLILILFGCFWKRGHEDEE